MDYKDITNNFIKEYRDYKSDIDNFSEYLEVNWKNSLFGVLPEFPALPAGYRMQGLRSLRDLTQHLTTRADDNHAPPVLTVPKAYMHYHVFSQMSRPGKVLRVASN